jgi:ABC-2 type transport system permease protein
VNPVTVAVRAGMRRGWIDLRRSMSSGQDIWGTLGLPLISLVVMFFLRGKTVPGTDFSLGAQAIPGIVGMNIVFTAMTGMSVSLTMDREDGTLLRAKATPNGVLGYLVGKVVCWAGISVGSLLVLLAVAAVLFDGLEYGRFSTWVTLVWVPALGLVAMLPFGAILGSLFESVQSIGWIWMLLMGLTVVSGVFYPVGGFPGWLQVVGQVFPIYWLGLGMRSALLPGSLAGVEVGDSWRHLETAGVLGAWAVVGLLLAPAVLRRMAARESGSRVASRREKAMQRVA